MVIGLRLPNMQELLYDNNAIFKTRIDRSNGDKSLYAVIPLGTRSFRVARVIDRGQALDSPEFIDDSEGKVTRVLDRFRANSDQKRSYMKKFFDKYVSEN